MKPIPRIAWLGSCLAVLFVLTTAGCGQQRPGWDTAAGVLMSPSADAGVPEAIKAVEVAVPPRTMQGTGLAGAMGGVTLKAQRAGLYDMLLPLPQLADSQAPVFYCLNAKPKTALSACRLQVRNDGNAYVSLQLDVSKDQEVAVEWSSVVLIAARMIVQNHTVPETFRAASACAQADDERIAELAGKLWPPRERRGTTPSTSRNSFVRCSDVGSP